MLHSTSWYRREPDFVEVGRAVSFASFGNDARVAPEDTAWPVGAARRRPAA